MTNNEIQFFPTRSAAEAAAEGIVVQSTTGTTHQPSISGGYKTGNEIGGRYYEERNEEFVYYVSRREAVCGALGQTRNSKGYHGVSAGTGEGEITCKRCQKLAK